jgi:hypothetical protein
LADPGTTVSSQQPFLKVASGKSIGRTSKGLPWWICQAAQVDSDGRDIGSYQGIGLGNEFFSRLQIKAQFPIYNPLFLFTR